MSINGARLFRYALLGESAANLSSAVPLLFFPELAISFAVKGPSQITPATKSLAQWIGAVIIALTAPLLLSYPNPVPSQGGDSDIVAYRRLTYSLLAVGEGALGTVLLAQYAQGDSGITDNFLLIGTGFMGAFLAMRSYFLFLRPSYMGAQLNAKKAK